MSHDDLIRLGLDTAIVAVLMAVAGFAVGALAWSFDQWARRR